MPSRLCRCRDLSRRFSAQLARSVEPKKITLGVLRFGSEEQQQASHAGLRNVTLPPSWWPQIGWYAGGMKIKTSVTLSDTLLKEIDRVDTNRSAFLERAALAYLARASREARDLRDTKILDRHSDRLNREAADVLEYQGLPE